MLTLGRLQFSMHDTLLTEVTGRNKPQLVDTEGEKTTKTADFIPKALANNLMDDIGEVNKQAET